MISGRELDPREQSRAIAARQNETGREQTRRHIPCHRLGTVRQGRFDGLATICFGYANADLYGPSATETNRIVVWKDSNLERCLRTLLASE